MGYLARVYRPERCTTWKDWWEERSELERNELLLSFRNIWVEFRCVDPDVLGRVDRMLQATCISMRLRSSEPTWSQRMDSLIPHSCCERPAASVYLHNCCECAYFCGKPKIVNVCRFATFFHPITSRRKIFIRFNIFCADLNVLKRVSEILKCALFGQNAV